MFYNIKRRYSRRRFDRAIADILKSPPLPLAGGNLAIVSMVSKHDIPMYLLALKSFYRRVGVGKVVAIVDRDLPTEQRRLLKAHVLGIELVDLEDIDPVPCQRGGTWERLVYCIDRSQTEYVIQLDSDTLTVGVHLDEVTGCISANRAFTMSDGFVRTSAREAADTARATPSNYIGIAVESALDRLSGADKLTYVRGSSGFAGFAKGGFDRAAIAAFHQEMASLIGDRWKEWGTEQCGSNFAIANSPDAVVLPYPDYSSFTARALCSEVKFFHFIGARRFHGNYFMRRGREEIEALESGARSPAVPHRANSAPSYDRMRRPFVRTLTPVSGLRYLLWRTAGGRSSVVLRMRARTEFRTTPGSGPRLELRPASGTNQDLAAAKAIFLDGVLLPPVWIPPERVELIVDVGANAGYASIWFLANYWRANVLAFEPAPDHAAQASRNFRLNGFEHRATLYVAPVGPKPPGPTRSDQASPPAISPAKATNAVETVDLFEALAGKRIDLLRLNIDGGEVDLLGDPRFPHLEADAIVMRWHPPDRSGRGGRDWCLATLRAAQFRTWVPKDEGSCGTIWAYRH